MIVRTILALLLVGLLASAVAQECTDDDYEAQYTQCRLDNKHDLVYYLKRNVNCTGGVHPNPPIFDLPCNITCGQGEYLPLGSVTCSPCLPGTFTRGGGRSVSEWDTWPSGLGTFSTICVNNLVANSPPINCSGWVLTGGTVRSGVITDVQSSILILQTQLIVAGIVRFSYRVDAEPNYDGLIFYIDDVIVLPRVSLTYVYVDFAANLSAGYHTLKWEYYKDRSVSKGDDAAYIRSLEIVGLTYAESSCAPCDKGSFTANSASIQCDPCPLNTFADGTGTTSCSPCPSGQYSYVGASECIPKVPCVAADYQILYGPCTSGSTRTATASWLQPHICDDTSLPLPSPTTVSCAPCPPGTSQDPSFNCVACPTGTYSPGGGASCQTCTAGSAAPKVFNFSTFDSWPAGVTTYCSGLCGTDGWRLRSSFIDSGAGHGEMVDSSLNIQLDLEQPGFVTFSFLLNCSRFCAVYFVDYPYDASIQWNTSSIGKNARFTYTTPVALEVGPHNLTWTFESEPYDPIPNSHMDAVRIYSIVINGTSVGGASSCVHCFNGSVAGDGASFCSNCTAGYSSDPSYSQCVACQGNTFSAHQGDVCYNCGPTTTANNNHTDCVDTCQFVLNGSNYDLTPLAHNKPFGPVYDGQYNYYINLCGRGNFVADCHDEDDVPLNTHVCQVLPYGYSLDVGWSTGYYAIPITTAEKGFRIHYDFGTQGCGPKNHGVSYPRNSDLTFICDPAAGVGSLQSGPITEDPPCHYNFVWRSLYACPICNTNDYTFYYTLCGSNGKRNKIYYWKDPILCHDGVKLPPTEEVSCSDSTVVCGINQQLSDDQTCVPCPDGEYSVGGGLLISSWPPGPSAALPYGYTTSCVGSCTPWVSEYGVSMHSGFGQSSLYGSHVFRLNGTISFQYKVFAQAAGEFIFYVDGQPQLTVKQISLYEWNNFSAPVTPGSHIFEWRFNNGIRYSPTLLTFQSVFVYNILVQGIDYHADTCLPCPDGTYSSTDDSVIGCLPCPANTYKTSQTSACTPCPSSQFSLPGSTSCKNKTACTPASYVPQYTPCVDGKRDVSYSKLLPDICAGGAAAPFPRYGIACADCPPYTIAQGAECASCPPGKYYKEASCANNVPGFIVQYFQVYFNDDSTVAWPAPFYTGCSGACGTDGWRIAGASINSGYHGSNAIDSYVGIIANFVFNGQVTFTYVLNTNNALDGFQFAIDNVAVSIPVPTNASVPVTVSVPVSNGLHTLEWNYHQEASTGSASVSNIVLQGVADGVGAGASVPCAAGLFSTDPAAVNCSVCGAGTFSPVAGSSTCPKCPKDTYNPYEGANECRPCDQGSSAPEIGSTQCQTSCVFNILDDSYDLTGLPGTVTAYDDSRRKYLINVCNNVGSQCPHSHSCIVSVDNSIIEAGNSFRFIPDPENSTATPFAIAFEHGDACPGAPNVARSTLIQFECDTESPSNTPDYQGQDAKCVTSFSWRSTSACRKCTDSDYATITGACSGGRRQVSRTRIANCNGPASTTIKEEKCSGQEFPLAAILVVVFVFVAVVAVAAFIFFRNRRLAAQYASLVEETRSTNISM